MPESCTRVGYHDTTSFALNILIHILILFTVLSLIYVLYISKVETKAFKGEIEDVISDNLPKALAHYDQDGKLKTLLKEAPLDKLAALYAKPDASTTIYNTWLFRTMGVIIAAITIIILITWLILYFSCSQCVPFWTILRDNLIVFFFVGIAEGLFFYKIASKFIPAPPSTLMKRVFTDLTQWS